MSSASHHAEWLQLVPHTGPFLSLPVLQRVFPQQLEALETGLRGHTRDALDDWREQPANPALYRAWILHVLKGVLHHPDEVIAEGQSIPPGLEARQLEHGEVLRPDFVLLNPAGHAEPRKPRLLVCVHPSGTDLDKPLAERRWKASPASRMAELCHAANVPLGLVTNGDHWMLVWAPRGETTGYASWFAHLWSEEPLTFRAFISLLRASRFFAVAAGDTLEALYTESARDQSEVTDQLGLQVRQAVQVLIQSLDSLDATHGRTLLAGTSEKELYNAALTVMMRLVFLFCAEEKGLLLLGNHLYDEHYAVSTLRELLRETADQHGEELLQHRHDAWCRLLAIFRAIHGGIEHDQLRLPAYGGGLFDPDRYPFLEGRPADSKWQATPARPLEINNRVVLHLLEALQTLETKLPGTSERQRLRLSFRALDIEQIGHVYEGLLDHTAKRARDPVLGLVGKKGEEPEIPLASLEELAGGSALLSEDQALDNAPFLMAADAPADVLQFPARKGPSSYSPPEELLEYLHEATGRSKSALKKGLTDRSRVDDGKLRIACGNDDSLVARISPFAALLRDDTFGRPLVFPGGSLYVTSGSDRRSTGTHYTPRSLTEPIVQHTLEPLVYVGPAEGLPKEQWKLKSAKELLALKVCDMAMGSGAFLVQTCRYLGERLAEAWEQAEKSQPGAFITTPEGELSTGAVTERLLPTDLTERLAIARRYVADRCLYGVDINPMAVEMAKLSLWLITLQRDRPFTFLDHALKCGDSLLGANTLKQVENFTLRAKEGEYVEHTFATANLFRYVEEASAKRRALENLPSNDHNQIGTKTRLHAEAEAATGKVKALADCLIAFELRGLDGDTYDEQRVVAADQAEMAMRKPLTEFQTFAREQLRGRRPFHWPVEFPEVFARGGFDAFVGNPPFVGGRRIRETLGDEYRDALYAVFPESSGNADLCAFFFLRCFRNLRQHGSLGLLATNTIAQGDTRETGLDRIVSEDGCIYRATNDMSWPGVAAVTVNVVHIANGLSHAECVLDGQSVECISAFLENRQFADKPSVLAENDDRSFQGSVVVGIGFILEPAQAQRLLHSNPANRDVVFPYLIGEDLNTSPTHEPSRSIINFFDWPLVKAEQYPDALSIVREKVYPVRAQVNREAHRKYWWHYGDKRPALYNEVKRLSRVLLVSRVTKHIGFAFVTKGSVYAETTVVVAYDDYFHFAVLQSNIHESWAWKYCSTMRNAGIRYSPSDCFHNFPFPVDASGQPSAVVGALGERYYEHRRSVMLSAQSGFTSTYNRFHDRGEQSADIAQLRALHVEMDQAVAAAYGWSDLDLGHGFHATKQGERYTLSEPARRTVLDRLLALNHQRYAEEVKAGLHEKKAAKTKRPKTKAINPMAPPAGDEFQFGLGLASPASVVRELPTGLRLPASDGAHYAVSLVFALLSEAGGSLPLPQLRDAFVLATSPVLMQRLGPAEDAPRVKAWAQRWKEDATPSLFIDCLKAIGSRHLTVSTGADGRVFQLLDAPRPPANEDVGYDAWLALRVSATLPPSGILIPEVPTMTRQAEELVLA